MMPQSEKALMQCGLVGHELLVELSHLVNGALPATGDGAGVGSGQRRRGYPGRDAVGDAAGGAVVGAAATRTGAETGAGCAGSAVMAGSSGAGAMVWVVDESGV